MILKPFWTYYGGKWRAAPHYPVPVYDTIVEPFAGGAGYALRYANLRVILVEKNPKVAATWRYLLNVSASEVRSLPLLERDQSVDDLQIIDEAKLLIGWNLNKGTVCPSKKPSRWMREDLRPSQFWSAARRERVARQVESIRHWTLIEGDYTHAPDIEATWFVDPPYCGAGKHYPTTIDDFGDLGRWCRERTGQVMVCENVGASWLPFQPFRKIKANASRHGGKVSDEAIWTNWDEDDEE